jgi:hypothetical protein
MNYQSPPLLQLVFDIKNLVSQGRTTKDFQIADDEIKQWILEYREKFLRQKISKGQSINEYTQNLGCVAVSPIDKSQCGCEIEIGCTFLRSDLPLPDFIGKPRIGPIDTTGKPYQLIPFEQVPLEKYSPHFSKKNLKGYFKDFENYLYLLYDEDVAPQFKYLTHINVQGPLVDPQQAVNFFNCNSGNPCYSDTEPFPISLNLWSDIKINILKTEFNIILGTQEDLTNNNKADNVQAGQKGK